MEADETFDPSVEEPEEELLFNNMALKNAVRRNMSIWRSHGVTGERQKYSTTDDEDDIDDDDETDDETESQVVSALAAETANDEADDEWCCDDSTAAGNLASFFSVSSNGLLVFFVINYDLPTNCEIKLIILLTFMNFTQNVIC